MLSQTAVGLSYFPRLEMVTRRIDNLKNVTDVEEPNEPCHTASSNSI
jgi:hypothetical protein